MAEVLSAKDIIPNLYDDSVVESSEDVVDDLSYDVYNLAAFNYHTLRIPAGVEQRESTLLEATERATQLLIKRLFECPIEKSEIGPLAVLPSETSVLPREKRIPEPKPETRWEKFSKEKGIKNKKRERMVYEEDTQEWKPRFGYKRAKNGVEDHAIVEVKAGQDPFADPWAEARVEKKERVAKNLKNQTKNIMRATGGKGKRAIGSSGSVPGIPVELSDRKAKRGKEGVRRALELAQHSTASMGRFDDMRPGEPARTIRGKKRSFRDNLDGSGRDKVAMKEQLRIVADKIDKKARGVTNSLAAYEGILPDAPSDSFRKKKGKGKVAGSKEGGGGAGKRKGKK